MRIFRKGENGETELIIIVYVDDCCIIGPKGKVNEAKEILRDRFGTVEDGRLRKLLGVRYDWKKEEETNEPYLEMTMNDKAKEILTAYEKATGKTPKNYASPGAPGTVLKRNEEETIMRDEYRSIIGKLMFYTTKIGPECAFAIGQLARHMQNPGTDHWKALDRAVGYIKGKGEHKLKMKKPSELRVISFADSSYADCKDTRRSSSGDMHTIGGAIVSWRAQLLKMLCLSSTEAEYVTLTEAAKEQKFIQMLLGEIMKCDMPGILYEDNEAAAFLTKNQQVSGRTKHIDLRCHYIREHVEKNRAIVMRTTSEENLADILTKNVSVGKFEELGGAILKGFKGWEKKFELIKEQSQTQIQGNGENDGGQNIEKVRQKISLANIAENTTKEKEKWHSHEFVRNAQQKQMENKTNGKTRPLQLPVSTKLHEVVVKVKRSANETEGSEQVEMVPGATKIRETEAQREEKKEVE